MMKVLKVWKGFQHSMNSQVKKREVFYLSGYDPRGARYYYNLYKKEGLLQSKVNDLDLDLSSRKRTDKHVQSWEIKSSSRESETTINYHFLEWDDIIRKTWIKDSLSLFIHLFYCIKYYIFSGVFFQIIKVSPRQIIPALYPAIYLLGSLCVSFYILIELPSLLRGYFLYSLEVVIGMLAFYISMKILLKIAEKLSIFWIISDYAFAARYVMKKKPELDKRIEYFITYIEKKITKKEIEKVDEILIVAHSLGTVLLIPILVKLLNSSMLSKNELEKVSILTLGGSIPLISFFDDVSTFKDEMKQIAENKDISWLDYTSIADSVCFPIDFFKSISLNVKFKLRFFSPRFHLLYTKERYKELRKDKFTFHFLYLMSTDKQGAFDFFKMTAGPYSLKSYFHKEKKR